MKSEAAAVAMCLLGVPFSVVAGAGAPVQEASRPNVVMIVVDDLRWDELGATGHPYVETPHIDRLAAEGAMFREAYHVTPLCSPNRASLRTGQYPTRHGIVDNVARNRMSHRLQTFPQELQKAGYETAFVGKWHMGNDPTPRAGYDYWVGFPGQGRIHDPQLYEDGELHAVEGYITDILTERTIGFIEQPRERPFFIELAHKAIHPDARQLDDGSVDLSYGMAYIPAERHRGRYDEATFPRRLNTQDPRTDTVVARALASRASPEIADTFGPILDPGTAEETIRRRAEMLLSVDDGIGRILDSLARQGILDETVFIFVSDNGFFFGEHGLSIERRMPYEEAVKTPLLMRYPPLVRPGTLIDDFALSIDLAPTILEFADAEIGAHIQGRSLVPLLRNQRDGWRQSFLIEFVSYEKPMPWLTDLSYRTVRSGRYKYIQWFHYEGMDELYDLASDPYELHNRIAERGLAGEVEKLRRELGRLVLDAAELPSER